MGAEQNLKPPHACIVCGRSDGVVQHYDIAWPTDESVGRRYFEGWVHAQCEAKLIERLEGKRKV